LLPQVSAGFLSIPMVFDLNTAMMFNELFVTAEVPDAKDLETPLEVSRLDQWQSLRLVRSKLPHCLSL
jgi:hypothetical protein